jgi:hypothetical protein
MQQHLSALDDMGVDVEQAQELARAMETAGQQ